MGRSVSYPQDSAAVCFTTFDPFDHTNAVDEWEQYVENLRVKAQRTWPSMGACDIWLDREDNAILENAHAYIGVSEYCGVVSIWLVSKADEMCCYPREAALADGWCTRVSNNFKAVFTDLELVGRASNGEAVFQRDDRGSVLDQSIHAHWCSEAVTVPFLAEYYHVSERHVENVLKRAER